MEIIYLKKFSQIKKIGGWKTEGMDLDEIEELEDKYNEGNPFPGAYREYLFIGGKANGAGFDSALGFDWLQEKSKEMLESNKQKIERPYFVMDQLDGCEQFGFFYLDESVDDPIIYNCAPPYVEDGYELIKPYAQGKLSDIITSHIVEAKSRDVGRGEYDTDED